MSQIATGVVTFTDSDLEMDDGDSGHSGGDDDDFAPGPMPTISPGPSRKTRASARARSGAESAMIFHHIVLLAVEEMLYQVILLSILVSLFIIGQLPALLSILSVLLPILRSLTQMIVPM